ncbi:relaxase/mobilization nuclease domain-containing protein [Arachidicoccus soli]|uniref:MobA/VirD2-like nuclease domain-containing protein n=1 Tax=Arachidicoccus soli TaxID=2341117 RepID=A0A386HKV7_9BACT|nr:relaxase/mobilization nuclease domain-containing protein [Arachidicoccus soli]AYD46373.1 hypothetical protein D6B99_01320 [Arachidicoccus soli]
MIGKAKSNLSLGNTIDYNLKQKSVLFYTNNLVGENIEDYRMQMEDLQKCYRGYGKQLLIHAVLSPATEDGKRLDESTWQKIADSYLQEMKLKEHYQSIGFIHRDKGHTHAHLVISKINMNDYKLFQDSFIGKKSQFIADRIAKEFGLVRAMEIKRENLKNLLAENENSKSKKANKSENIKPQDVRQKFKHALMQINEQKFNTPEVYFLALEKNGFKVIRHFDDKQNLRGYSIEKEGTMMSATAVSKEFSLSKLGLINMSYRETKEKLNNNTPPNKTEKKEQITAPILSDKKSLEIYIEPLNDSNQKDSLQRFLKDFGIDKETIDKSELQFIKHKNYYYAALKNNSGGWAVMNPFTQTNIGAKDIITICEQKNVDVIICGDAFSYLKNIQNNGQNTPANYIILNEIFDGEKLKKTLEYLQPKQILYAAKEQRLAGFLKDFSQKILSDAQQENTTFIHNYLDKAMDSNFSTTKTNSFSNKNNLASFMELLFSEQYQGHSVAQFIESKKKMKWRKLNL